MKRILFAAIVATFFGSAGFVQGGLFNSKGIPNKPPHHLAPEWVCPANCVPKEKIVKTHTIELRRCAFQKWEEYCCGIKMKGNYIRVSYETFYSDGSSTVWCREYRS